MSSKVQILAYVSMTRLMNLVLETPQTKCIAMVDVLAPRATGLVC